MATSKRASADESESEMKRAKLDECVAEYDVVLGDKLYVNLEKLFKCVELQSFFISKYKNSIKGFITTEGLNVVKVTKENVEKGVLKEKKVYGSKTDVRLVEKDERIMNIIASAKESLYPRAPPVIEDKDLTFFVDKDGESYHVEMRGERTVKGIYFKAKHVGAVFDSKNFVNTIVDARKSYRESIDFVWFAIQKPATSSDLKSKGSDTSKQGHFRKSDHPLQEQDHHSLQEPKPTYKKKQDVFLTFSGLMLALHIARSPEAEKFRDWVYNQVFALAYGTLEQKKEFLAELCKVDKIFLQAFMKLVPNDLACIYLVDTKMRDGDATVYKFGRSGKTKDRFKKHHFTYGEGTQLDTIIFVPPDALSEAEASLSKSMTENVRFRYEKVEEPDTLNNADRKATELVTLTDKDRIAVRTIMQTIAEKYNGSMAIQASKHAEEMKDLKIAHKSQLDEMKHAHEIEINELKKTYELSAKDMEREIAVFKAQKEMATMTDKLQLENAQLKADAKDKLLEEKDERIRRLEETVRLLSKRQMEPEYRP